MTGLLRNEVAIFLLGVQFLTRLPIPSGVQFTPRRLSASVRYYPSIGLLIGAITAAVYWVFAIILPPALAVLISGAAGLLLTGAFHEDGLADTFDGIGGSGDPKRALEIMKDSRIGTYGAAALIMVLAIKMTALTLLPPPTVLIGLVVGHGLSRLSSVLVIATSRYVRDQGTAKPTADGIGAVGLIIATLTGGIALLALAHVLTLVAALFAGVGLIAGHVLMRLFFEPKLGGYTGDTLGAVQQISEMGFYLGLLACL